MGLKDHELEDVAIWHVRDAEDEPMYADGPDGEPDLDKPLRIHLYGPGTQQQAKAQQKRNNRTMARLQKKGGRMEMSADEALEDNCEFLIGCTKAFENIASDRDPPATGQDLYREIYMNRRLMFISQGAESFARETRNFRKASSKT